MGGYSRVFLAIVTSLGAVQMAWGAAATDCLMSPSTHQLARNSLVRTLQFHPKKENTGNTKGDPYALDGDFDITQTESPGSERTPEFTTYTYSFSNHTLYAKIKGRPSTDNDCFDNKKIRAAVISNSIEIPREMWPTPQMECLKHLKELQKILEEYPSKFAPLNAETSAAIRCAQQRLERAFKHIAASQPTAKKKGGFADEQKDNRNHDSATTND